MFNWLSKLAGLPDNEIAFTTSTPNLETPTWQLCTAAQFDDPFYLAVAGKLHFDPNRIHRKLWEWVYIVRVIERMIGDLSGKNGLTFGVGKEPMVAHFAANGANVLATDLDPAAASASGWIETQQHAASVENLQYPDICAPARLRRRVTFMPMDMNNIPKDISGFDFLWSSCSFEHLGSLDAGLKFVERAMHCLRPGGTAVHTTEFNVNSDDTTLETRGLSIYRRRDLVKLASRLARDGNSVPLINFERGTTVRDGYIDMPPYRSDLHLKLKVSGFVTTSFGLFARREAEPKWRAAGRSGSRPQYETARLDAAAELPDPPYMIKHYVLHNSAPCENGGGDTLRVVTPAQPWAYALELPLQDALDGRGVKVEVTASVRQNPVRFGILHADGRAFVQEVEVAESAERKSIELVVPAGTPAGSLILRTSGKASAAVEFGVRASFLQPSSPNLGSPAAGSP